MGIKAVIIGGSGATGKELINQLLERPEVERVTVLLRRPYFKSHKKLNEVIVDFNMLAQFSEHIEGDIAFSTLGTTIKDAGSQDAQWKVDHDYPLTFAEIAKQNGVNTFVLLSSMQADPNAKLFYPRMKGTLERAIHKLNFPSYIILRPGIIDRPNTDRAGEKAAVGIIKFLNKIGLFRRFRAIQTKDLAKALITASIDFPKTGEQLYESEEILNGIKR